MRRQTAGPGQRWPAGRQPPHGFSDPQQDWVSDWQTDERFWTSAETVGPERAGDERWAMLSYLGVPFLAFLVPLAIYLIKMRSSRYVRSQAAQAFNLSVTVLLYSVCIGIFGVMLALDTPGLGLLAGASLAAALWLVALGYVVRAAIAASRGEHFSVPSWICATIAR
jgi:uncharacterized protein